MLLASWGMSEATLAQCLVNASHEGLLALSSAGRVLSWNRGAEQLFGYASSEALGRSLEELIIPAERREKWRAQLSAALGGNGARAEGTSRRKDGSSLYTEVLLQRIAAPAGETMTSCDGVLVTAVIRNIGERGQLQERAQETSRGESELLASLSHELRTPLNAIIGFAQLMRGGKVGPISGKQEEYLGDILTSSRHLLQLLNDVLELAKVESGKLELSPEPLDPSQLVCEVRDISRGLAAGKSLTLTTRVEPELGQVRADPQRLKQVLYNYLSNAIKFTPEGGRVSVRVQAAGPDWFRVDVQDTGIGISPEQLGKLFVEYQQLGPARDQQGTGLGLALVKRIVEAQGGRVEVHSVLGRGSTFSAILPREGRLVREPFGRSAPSSLAAATVLSLEGRARARHPLWPVPAAGSAPVLASGPAPGPA